MNKIADIYIRVSTQQQEESLEAHKSILLAYCDKNNYHVNQTYMEIVSGNKKGRDRPMFAKLMEDIEKGKINIVVALKLDRFSRSLLDLLSTIEYFQRHNVEFVCIYDNFDTTTPQGKLLLHMLGALGEFERSLIYERTKIGIDRAKREGKICNRPRKEVNMARIFKRIEQGVPLTEIAAVEHVSYSTLRNRLKEVKEKLGE